ncbi:hypothetical protein [Actinoplanes siamensis]|uniref:Uncharacterized protein n=1 Tax=Actinoplanes siamensis TaxID=1223317 RepID=A0A919N423_9ACTN|nr:hypothetical protein [Actinoplanes siamensis]GIF03976.1 hypothetical protein Asi03nite_15140 [Actinoplanes siamensis]
MTVLVALVLLVAAAFLLVPAMVGVKFLMAATSLLSFSSLFASFMLLVSSASIATFLQLAVLALSRRRARAAVPPADLPALAAPAGVHAVALPADARAADAPADVRAFAAPAGVRGFAPPAGVSAFAPPAGGPQPAPAGLGKRSLRLVPFLLAALTLLPGCTQAPAAQAAAPAACGSEAPGQVAANAELRDGKASPAPHRVAVPLGSQVRLGISVDSAAQIHVHGYDLEYQVRPGQPMCIVFVASRAGLFDVEAHPDTLLLQLEVK